MALSDGQIAALIKDCIFHLRKENMVLNKWLLMHVNQIILNLEILLSFFENGQTAQDINEKEETINSIVEHLQSKINSISSGISIMTNITGISINDLKVATTMVEDIITSIKLHNNPDDSTNVIKQIEYNTDHDYARTELQNNLYSELRDNIVKPQYISSDDSCIVELYTDNESSTSSNYEDMNFWDINYNYGGEDNFEHFKNCDDIDLDNNRALQALFEDTSSNLMQKEEIRKEENHQDNQDNQDNQNNQDNQRNPDNREHEESEEEGFDEFKDNDLESILYYFARNKKRNQKILESKLVY